MRKGFFRLRRPLAAILLLALRPAPAPAAQTAAQPPEGAVHVPFVRYQLPNGLVVVLHEDHSLPQVVVNLWYRVGSKDERPGRTGFAHLFEHLMFMGSKHVPYDLDQGAGLFDLLMEQHGGINNATTSTDRTDYFEGGPPELLETFLWLEADRMATLPDVIDAVKVERQRRIVQNERRQSYENRPYGRTELLIPEEMYPPEHPYHHPVIGSHEDLEAATPADVQSFFRQFYTPRNAQLVIAGDFESARAKGWVEKYFGWIPSGPEVARAKQPMLKRPFMPKRRTLTDQVELPRSVLVYHAPAAFAAGSAECEVLAALLGHGKSSRLERALRLAHPLAQEVLVGYEPDELGGLLMIELTAQPGHTLTELERAADAELAAVRAQAASPEELERAIASVEMRFAQELEPLWSRAELLNRYEAAFQDPSRIAWDLERHRKVTPNDVFALAKQLLDPRNRLVVRVEPTPRTEKGTKP